MKSDVLFRLLPQAEAEQFSKQVPQGETPLWVVWPDFVRKMLLLNRKKATLNGVRDTLRFLVRKGGFLTVESFRQNELENFLLEQKEVRGWKSWTYNTHVSKLSRFFANLKIEGRVVANPVHGLTRCGQDPEYQPTLTVEEVNQIIGCLANDYHNDFVALRDLVFVMFMANTGCRLSEALRIRVSDIDYKNQTWRINPSKGGKPRVLRLSKNLMGYLENYLAKRKEFDRHEEELFVSIHKRGKAWTTSGVRKMIERLKDKTKITKLTCHSFRRYVATRLAEQNVPITKIQFLLGHSRLSTTIKYINSIDPGFLDECTSTLDCSLRTLVESRADDARSNFPGASC